jgi:hypothetical protein
MTPPTRPHHRATAPLAVLVTAMLVFFGAAAQASATVRFAVPGGTGADGSCTSTGANCSLRHVLEDVILTADEVIVTPGTHDLGSNGVAVRTGSNSVNIHGAVGQARPTIRANAIGFVFSLCLNSCPADLSTVRHLRIENVGTGSALFFFGGTAGNPVSIDDVEAVAGTGAASLAIMGFSQTGLTSEATIRNSVAYAPNAATTGGGAISSGMNLTMRNVTAVAPAANGIALTQTPMCNDGIACSGDTSTQIFNSILEGGPGGVDVRTTTSTNGCGACFGNVLLDYSNFDSVINCGGCSTSPIGSAHNQSATPLLVGGSDFHQQPGSPTIDAGVDAVANGSTDPDGNPRKLGAAPDIGAFEDGHARPTTEAAVNVTETGATLRGSVNPLGFPTTYYFDWGTTTAYGNRIPATDVSAGSGAEPQAVSQDLTGLAPGTTVHYRLVAANSFGPVGGADQSFATLVPPQVQPLPVPGAPSQFTFAGVRLTASSFVVRRGRYVLLPIRCPVGVTGNCVGKVKLVTASAVTLPRVGTAAAAKKKLTLGTASFSVRGGATKKVKLALSRPARKLLKAKRSVKAVATLTATANGQTKRRSQKVTVKLARRR